VGGTLTYPTYHFDPIKYPLSMGKYRLYARPQLNNMTKEFYHIISKFSFYAEDLLSSRKLFLQKLYVLQEQLHNCNAESCHKVIKTALYNSIKLNQQLTQLKRSLATDINSFTISENDLVHFTKFIRLCFKLEYQLETQLNKTYLQQNFQTITKSIQGIYHQFNYLIIDTLPLNIKKEFEQVWFFFFRPIEQYVLPSMDPDNFLKRVEDLNITWNSFHMKISKGEMKIPRNGHKIILTMHARWVSILKLFLKK
jgi:hypothetical protein